MVCIQSELRFEVNSQLQREPECVLQAYLSLDGDAGSTVESESETGTCIETPLSSGCPSRLCYHEVVCRRNVEAVESECTEVRLHEVGPVDIVLITCLKVPSPSQTDCFRLGCSGKGNSQRKHCHY